MLTRRVIVMRLELQKLGIMKLRTGLKDVGFVGNASAAGGQLKSVNLN